MNSFLPKSNSSFNQSASIQHQQVQSHDPWFLSEMSTIVRQNQQNTNILLSTTAQQILSGNSVNNNNNRPLRSEKIDIEVIKHLIRQANWKRQCGMKKEVIYIFVFFCFFLFLYLKIYVQCKTTHQK